MTPSYLVIANTNAHGLRSGAALNGAVEVLRAVGSVDVAFTSHLAQLDQVIEQRRDHVVVIAGGDGSIHAAIRSLDEQGGLPTTTIGLLPLGTGNDVVRALRLPLDPIRAAAVIAGGHSRPQDLIVDENGYTSINVVHFGIGALASASASRLKRVLGRTGYPVAAALVGLRTRRWNLSVTIDEARVVSTGPHVLVAICNGPFIGGGHSIAQEATSADGMLDLVIVPSNGFRDQLALGIALAKNRATNAHMIRLKAQSIRITSTDALPWAADGDTGPPRGAGLWHVRPGGWTVLLPHGTNRLPNIR